MRDVQHVEVGVVLEDGATNLGELVARQPEAVEAVQVLQLLAEDGPDPVLPEVEGPELGERVDVLGDGVQVVVVESEVLQERTAGQEARGEEGEPVVVQGEGGEGGQAGQGGGGQLRQLVVGEQQDVEVDQVAEGVVGDVGQVIVLEVEDLEVVLLGQGPALQFGESVVAEVQGHQLGQTGEYSVREQVTGDVVVGHVEQQEVLHPGEQVSREEGEGVVLEEELLEAGGLLEDGGGESRQVVVGDVQQGEGGQAAQRVVRED